MKQMGQERSWFQPEEEAFSEEIRRRQDLRSLLETSEPANALQTPGEGGR